MVIFLRNLNSWFAGTHENHENWYTTNKNEFTVFVHLKSGPVRGCFWWEWLHKRRTIEVTDKLYHTMLYWVHLAMNGVVNPTTNQSWPRRPLYNMWLTYIKIWNIPYINVILPSETFLRFVTLGVLVAGPVTFRLLSGVGENGVFFFFELLGPGFSSSCNTADTFCCSYLLSFLLFPTTKFSVERITRINKNIIYWVFHY